MKELLGASALVWLSITGVQAQTPASTPTPTPTPTPTSTYPSTQPVTQTFSEITVMGEKLNQSMPWATQTNRAQLDDRQVQSWSELSGRVDPAVNFSQSTNSINIRGLDQSRVLTRVDGIRQSYLRDIRGGMGGVSGGVSQIDFNSLSSIDIVRGSDSSSVGSGALGGVVDVRTLTPEDLLRGAKKFGSLTKTGYLSVDNSWLINQAFAGQATDRMQWLVQAGVAQGNQTLNQGTVGGYGLTRTEPNPDNFTQQNYLLKLQNTFDGGHKIGLTGAYFNRQDNITDLTASPLTFKPGQSNTTEQSTRQSLALDYAWANQGGSAMIDSLAAQVYWQQVQLANELSAIRTLTPAGAYLRKNTLEESTYGLDLQATKTIQGAVDQFWEGGVEWYSTQTKQYVKGQDTCTSYRFPPCFFLKANQADMPTTNGDQYGVWLQNTLDFANKQFSLTPAMRFDAYSQRPNNSSTDSNPVASSLPSSSGQAWSPKLLAIWRPADQLSLFVQYAQGFNAPTATQLYSRYGSPGTYLIQGNPNLKAETSQGWEIGTKLGDKHVNGSLTYFDNRYENFIESVMAVGNAQYPYFIQSYQNLADVRIYGLEARGEWRVHKGWRTYGSLAWTVGEDQSTQKPLNSVAPLKTIAGVEYATNQWSVRTQITAAAARTQVANPQTDFKAPGYGVMDVMATWQPEQIKGLSVQIGLYNVFNKTYWNALDVPSLTAGPNTRSVDAYTQPGRNVAVTLTYLY